MEVLYGRPRSRKWERLGHGLYLTGGPRTTLDELAAWSLVLPARAAFTHLTAAKVRGWWLPAPVFEPVFAAACIEAPAPRRPGLRVSRLQAWPRSQVVAGIRIVESAEAILAACADLGLLDLVQFGDSALRLEHCSIGDLEAAAMQRRSGAVRLRALIPLLDKRSESPWESVMRVLHRAADIPIEPQKEFYDPAGRFVARADLWLVGTHRIHEYDGADHCEKEQHRRDLRRDRRLNEIGIQRFGYTDLELLRQGWEIIAAADATLGRGSDPARWRRWQELVEDSLWGRRGRARAAARWKSAR